MARYRDYEKGNTIGSIRMFGCIDKDKFYIEYKCIEDVSREDISSSMFDNPMDAVNHMTGLGYREY